MDIYINNKLNVNVLCDITTKAEIDKNCPRDKEEIVKCALSDLHKPFNMFDYVEEAFSLNLDEQNAIEKCQSEKIKNPLLQLQTTAFSNNGNEFKFLKEMQSEGIPYDNDSDEDSDENKKEQKQNTRETELNELTEKKFLVYLTNTSQPEKISEYHSVVQLLYNYLNKRLQNYYAGKIESPFSKSPNRSLASCAFREGSEYTISDYFNDLGIQNNAEIAEKINNDTDFNCFYILLSNHKLRKILFENIQDLDSYSASDTDDTFKLLNDFSWDAYKKDLKFKIPGTNREIEWAKINKFIGDSRFSNDSLISDTLISYCIKCDYEEISKFTYFCILYLKIRNKLNFESCECCGRRKPVKPSNYDHKNDYYCENCKSSAEFKEMKSKMNKGRKKFEKAINGFKDKVRKDDPEVYKENYDEISFYENLIIKLHDQTDEYLKEDFKVTVGKTMPDDNTNYNEKYNDLTNIYETYFTSAIFFKILTAKLEVTKKEINSWEITIFDEAIRRLRESHNIDLKDFENFEKVYAEYEENWKNQKKVPVEKFLYDPKNDPENYQIQEQT